MERKRNKEGGEVRRERKGKEEEGNSGSFPVSN